MAFKYFYLILKSFWVSRETEIHQDPEKSAKYLKILIFFNALVCEYPLSQASWWVQLMYQLIKELSQLSLLTAYTPYGGVGRVIRVNFGRTVPWFVIGTLGERIGLCLWLPRRRNYSYIITIFVALNWNGKTKKFNITVLW